MLRKNVASSLWQYVSYFLIWSLIMVACQTTPQPTSTAPVIQNITSAPDAAATENAIVSESQSGLPIIDTFEFAALPTGMDGSARIGFLTWSDGSPVVIEPVIVEPSSPLALPNQTSPNTVMRLDTTISSGGWGGYSHAFEDQSATKWQPQDWYPYRGISFWVYGNATGGTIFMDVLDNRGPASTADDAERWTYNIADDFKGWKYFEIPFEEFRRMAPWKWELKVFMWIKSRSTVLLPIARLKFPC
jgi:hypothetical protein